MSNVCNIQSLFYDRKFRIPNYHRDYVWRKKEIEALLLNIESVLNSDSSHYLGTLIMSKADDEVFNVLDGQQRLTTIVLILQIFINQLPPAERLLNISIDLGRNNDFVLGLLAQKPIEPESHGQERLIDAYFCINDKAKAVFTAGGELLIKKWLNALLLLEVIPYYIDRTGSDVIIP